MLRARDVMQTSFPVAGEDEPIREAGLAMARADLELVAIVDADGALIGVVTERALARRYIRESRHTSTLEDAPTYVHAVVDVLDGELLSGEDRQLSGRVWVHSIDVNTPSGISDGDVVVVGDRPEAQLLVIELGAALLVLSNSGVPTDEVLELARGRGHRDRRLAARHLRLGADDHARGAVPCADGERSADRHARLPDRRRLRADQGDPLRRRGRDRRRPPSGRADHALGPGRATAPRLVLVDHAEQAQSVPGIEQAEIVEILDHHHIGSIETRVPVTATFDPVGSTATLVVERFRQNGIEPSRPTAMMLLGAVLSDTVILNSPTTTERDHAVVEYLERVLALDAREFGREMFEATSDVSDVSAEEIVTRDAKRYQSAAAPRSASRRSRSSARPCWSASRSCSRRCGASARTRTSRSTR